MPLRLHFPHHLGRGALYRSFQGVADQQLIVRIRSFDPKLACPENFLRLNDNTKKELRIMIVDSRTLALVRYYKIVFYILTYSCPLLR